MKRTKPRFNADEKAFIKHVPFPPRSRRDPPRAINRNHVITVEESVERSYGRAIGTICNYEYVLHATKGWRRRRVYAK